MFLFSFLGASILVENSNFLTLLLGCLLCLYGCFSLFIKKIVIASKWVNPDDYCGYTKCKNKKNIFNKLVIFGVLA